jgi:hypothetical protein
MKDLAWIIADNKKAQDAYDEVKLGPTVSVAFLRRVLHCLEVTETRLNVRNISHLMLSDMIEGVKEKLR